MVIAKTSQILLLMGMNLIASAFDVFAQFRSAEIHGQVRGAATNSGLANASVIVLGPQREVITDSAGYYKLLVPLGKHKIHVLAEGFRSLRQEIVVEANEILRLDFSLQPLVYAAPHVEVTAERLKFAEAARTHLRPQELRAPPPLAEPDVLRAIHALPGVAAVTDWGSEFYVRGGHFDQTLVTWDEVPVYNANHLGGLFSAFNTDAIRSVTLYKGGQPLYFNSRLSGVLNIKPAFGNREQQQWNGFFGISSASLATQGPLGPGSYALSARRTYLDFLSLAFGEQLPYNFWDGSVSYKTRIGQRDALSLSLFHSTDRLQLSSDAPFERKKEKIPVRWGNRLLSLRWQHTLNPRQSLELSAFRTAAVVQGEASEARVRNRIEETGMSSKVYAQIPSHLFLFTLEWRRQVFSYSWSLHSDVLSDVFHPPAEAFFDYAPPDFDFHKVATAAALSLEDEIALSKRWTIALGAKANWHSGTESLSPMPRMGVTYLVNDGLSLRAVAARYYQHLYTLKERRTENILAPFTLYFPAQEANAIPASRADHFILGGEARNLPFDLTLNLEAYLKGYHNVVTSVNDLPHFRLENGSAAGFDFQLARETGGVSGTLGYSFSASKKRNGNFEYYTSYDRRHNVKLLGSARLNRRWQLNFFWTYASGAPYTPVIGRFNSGKNLREERSGTEIPIDWPGSPISARPLEGAKNSLRFPAFHRMDLALQGEFRWGQAKLFPALQIVNVYNNDNAFHYTWELNYREPKQETATGIPLLPTVGIRFEF